MQSIYYLNPKFQASSHLLWLYSLVCVGPGRKPRRPVFSERGSNVLQYHKSPKVSDSQNVAEITIKFKQRGLSIEKVCLKGGMTNSVDPDQTAPREEQSDLGLHCLPRRVCPKASKFQSFFTINFFG